MCSPFLVDIGVWHLHYHAHLTNHHISRELPYTWAYDTYDIHPSLGFHCIPYIPSYKLDDDDMMLSQHLTCASEFKEVLREMWLDTF